MKKKSASVRVVSDAFLQSGSSPGTALEPLLLTVRQAAAVLSLSVSCVRAWILQRRIPFVKLHNKAVRIRRADIDTLIASSVVPAVEREGRAA